VKTTKTTFAEHILPLFRRPEDIMVMRPLGLDLADYESVKRHAAKILSRLADGSMPCDDPWPPDWIARFREWMNDGMLP
jgi:hypothetical protein